MRVVYRPSTSDTVESHRALLDQSTPNSEDYGSLRRYALSMSAFGRLNPRPEADIRRRNVETIAISPMRPKR